MDVTNAVSYWDEWDTIFSVMEEDEGPGQQGPEDLLLGLQWAGHHRGARPVRQIYKAGKYKDLWYYWDGKPLLLYNGMPSVDANGRA